MGSESRVLGIGRAPALLSLLGLLIFAPPVRADAPEEREPASPEVCQAPEAIAGSSAACGTCGIGAFAATLALTAPATAGVAIALYAATASGWLVADPADTYGVPLWGYGAGCAVAHIFLAAMSSAAFWRDVILLCGTLDERQECPDPTPIPVHRSATRRQAAPYAY